VSKLLFREVLQSHGHVIDAAWVRAYCDGLERKNVHDGFGWAWAAIMSPNAEVRAEVRRRAGKSAKVKPLGCILCGDQPATEHELLVGKICIECFVRMNVDDVEVPDAHRHVVV
jgi:hypothetical protein